MVLSDFFKGMGKSEYDQNGFHSLVGCDIHSTPGKIKSNFVLTKESGSTVDEAIRCVVTLSDSTTFWFSRESGKIWKRETNGDWTLVHTNTVGACGGAAYFNQYIYYASGSKLGRISAANAVSQEPWSGENDTWGTFASTNTSHPMIELNLQLFIGGGRYVSSVNSAGVLNNQALDITYGMVIPGLANWETDLIIGSKVGAANGKSYVYRWDTYSDSWTVDDDLPENGVHMFVKSDNRLLAQIGEKSGMYEYDGVRMTKLFDIRDESGLITQKNLSLPSGATTFDGAPLFVSDRGVFSYRKIAQGYPDALTLDYITTGGRSAQIGCVVSAGDDLLVSWNYGGDAGVDKLSTNRTNGVITTPLIAGEFQMVEVKYSSLPAGTSISIRTKVDGGSWTAQTSIVDSINKIVYFDGGLGTVNTLQAEITMTSSGASTPEIEGITFK